MNSSAAIMRKSGLQATFSFGLIALLVTSDVLYLNALSGRTSFFLLSVLPLFTLWSLVLGKVALPKLIRPALAFFVVLSAYSIYATFLYSRPTLLVQIVTSTIAPILFLQVGYFGTERVLAISLGVALAVNTFFAFSQYLLHSVGIGGGSLEALAQFTYNSQIELLGEAIYGRSSGLFSNPNILGLFGGICFWFFILNKDGLNSRIRVSMLLLSTGCVVLSISRGSLIALVVSVATFLATTLIKTGRPGFRPPKLTSVLLALTVTTCLAVYFFRTITSEQLSRFSEVLTVVGGDVSGSENLDGRFQAWGVITNELSTRPFGTILPPQLVIDQSPDNQFIYYYAQGGVFLLLASVLLFVFLLIRASALPPPRNAACFCLIVFVLINSFSMAVINSYVFLLFWMSLGYASSKCSRPKLS